MDPYASTTPSTRFFHAVPVIDAQGKAPGIAALAVQRVGGFLRLRPVAAGQDDPGAFRGEAFGYGRNRCPALRP